MKCLLPLFLLLALPLALTFSSCDCCPQGKDDPLATEILDVKVEPNPVVVGGTAMFTVITRDSLNINLNYKWRLPEGFVDTKTHQYTWTATTVPGEYSLRVRVSRTDGTYTPTQHGFKVRVVAP